jgi:hypothetical protein
VKKKHHGLKNDKVTEERNLGEMRNKDSASLPS